MIPTEASSLETYARSLLRIVAGFTFSLHGCQKLFGGMGGAKVPFLSLHGVAGFLEVFGGFLILLDLLTKPVAFLRCTFHGGFGPFSMEASSPCCIASYFFTCSRLGPGSGA